MTSRIEEIHGDEMREQVIDIVIDALNQQGFPTMSRATVRENPEHRTAFLALLDDCRPLPVIVALKQEVQRGQV